jgi:superfamily II DNA/RNA helicase
MKKKFIDFGLEPKIIQGLESMGFEHPTPIQEQAIPEILAGKDVLGVAQTGTGKTAAYLLPVISRLLTNPRPADQIGALVIAPTRELAMQIDMAFEGLSYFTGTTSAAIYGGGDAQGFDTQKKALTSGTDVIIATPGKLISHLNLGYVKLDHLQCLILDEADKMLDMGFMDDILKIISMLPKQRQNLLFSATMPPKIRELAGQIMKDPIQINIAISQPAEGIVQAVFMVYPNQKVPLISHLLQARPLKSVIIFCSRKSEVREITRALQNVPLEIREMHSDLEQSEREHVINEFRNRKVQVLVATDILSRGIDIDGIELVINYNLPSDAEDYIHRIGRTARASSTGLAFTFVSPDDLHNFHKIERLIKQEIKKIKLPASIGEGPAYLSEEEYKRNRPKGQQKGRGDKNRRNSNSKHTKRPKKSEE